MKKILSLFLLIYSSLTFADPIEDFTFEDATRIVEYLKENPFMIDYCDCCDEVLEDNGTPPPPRVEAKLIRIIEREVIPCEYNSERYSIRITAEVLATGIVEHKQMTNLRIIPRDESETYTPLLSANYFFCADNRKIGQLGMLTQDDNLYKEYDCGGIKHFPEPSTLGNIISMKQYVKWYRKNARD